MSATWRECSARIDCETRHEAQLPDQNQQLPGVKLDTKAVTQLQSPWDVAAWPQFWFSLWIHRSNKQGSDRLDCGAPEGGFAPV